MSDKEQGLYNKYTVRRSDGTSEAGEKHEHCSYFVIDLNHDKYAKAALLAYAEACAEEFPLLAEDLRLKANPPNVIVDSGPMYGERHWL